MARWRRRHPRDGDSSPALAIAAVNHANSTTAGLATSALATTPYSSTATRAHRSTTRSADAMRRVPPQIQATIAAKTAAQPMTPASTARHRYSLCAAAEAINRLRESSGSRIALLAPRP